MNNSGIWDLGSREITAVLTDEVLTDGSEGEFITDLEGLTAMTLFCQMVGGIGGTSIAVIVQTSINQGAAWLDIARFDFVNTAAIKVANLSGLLSKAVTTYAALSAEGVLDGILGDRLRAKVTSVGTYSGNTSIAVRVATR